MMVVTLDLVAVVVVVVIVAMLIVCFFMIFIVMSVKYVKNVPVFMALSVKHIIDNMHNIRKIITH